MAQTISIGAQSFEFIRTNNCFYVDKTGFIKEWWENLDSITLITRPRRFGKTLNLNMLECFFSNKYADRSDLFEGLSIWEDEKYHSLQGSYPVIFLSFADVKQTTYTETRKKICQKLEQLFSQHSYLKDSPAMNENDLNYFNSVTMSMSDATASAALQNLSYFLYRHYGKKALIFLDEYDTPMQEAYVNGYWEEMVPFIRSIFNSTFKTNPFADRAIMTGITRISKESIFSDLNNLEMVTTTSRKYASCFGFTETEVKQALEGFHLADQMENVKKWYDGFSFGEIKNMYNPWSITKYLSEQKFQPYWVNTSAGSLITKLIQQGSPKIKVIMEDLLSGKPLFTEIDEEIVFNQLSQNENAIWSLLLASGYLRAEQVTQDPLTERFIYELKLTNKEVVLMFENMVKNWFAANSQNYNAFIKALLLGDVRAMNRYMNRVALSTFSYFDTGRNPSEETEPERFYHGFVLGLMVELTHRYQIRSNRESGFGRYDVMLEPIDKNDPAFILEFKVYDPYDESTLEDTVAEAKRQIETKAYDAELIARGIAPEHIRHYGFAFEGKKVLIG